jgi:hypothetical protein
VVFELYSGGQDWGTGEKENIREVGDRRRPSLTENSEFEVRENQTD